MHPYPSFSASSSQAVTVCCPSVDETRSLFSSLDISRTEQRQSSISNIYTTSVSASSRKPPLAPSSRTFTPIVPAAKTEENTPLSSARAGSTSPASPTEELQAASSFIAITDKPTSEISPSDLETVQKLVKEYRESFLAPPSKDNESVFIAGWENAIARGSLALIKILQEAYGKTCIKNSTGHSPLTYCATVQWKLFTKNHLEIISWYITKFPDLLTPSMDPLPKTILLGGHVTFLRFLLKNLTKEKIQALFTNPRLCPLHEFFKKMRDLWDLEKANEMASLQAQQKRTLELLVECCGPQILEVEHNGQSAIQIAYKHKVLDYIPDCYFEKPSINSLAYLLFHMSEGYYNSTFSELSFLPKTYTSCLTKFEAHELVQNISSEHEKAKRSVFLDNYIPLTLQNLKNVAKILPETMNQSFMQFLVDITFQELNKATDATLKHVLSSWNELLRLTLQQRDTVSSALRASLIIFSKLKYHLQITPAEIAPGEIVDGLQIFPHSNNKDIISVLTPTPFKIGRDKSVHKCFVFIRQNEEWRVNLSIAQVFNGEAITHLSPCVPKILQRIVKLQKEPNVARITDYHFIQSRELIFFSKFHAGSFIDLINSNDTYRLFTQGPLKNGGDFVQALVIALDILRFFTVLHTKGMAFVDIKAENILIARGKKKIARAFVRNVESIQEFDQNGSILSKTDQPDFSRYGSEPYFSLELRGFSENQNSSSSQKARLIAEDIWEIGVLIYQIFTNLDFWKKITAQDNPETLHDEARKNFFSFVNDEAMASLATEVKALYTIIEALFNPVPSRRLQLSSAAAQIQELTLNSYAKLTKEQKDRLTG